MELLELNLKSFGKFKNYRLSLHDGINVISGGNETGKSTMHAFIRAMLYGITRTRSRQLDEYQLRQPWDDPAHFEGALRLACEGKVYRIERNFLRREESVEVVCESDGVRIEDPESAIRSFTGGLSESDFDNTIFIRQSGAQTSAELGAHLRDFLVNVEQSGDFDLDVSAAADYLKKKRRGIEAEKQEKLAEINGRIHRKIQESEFLQTELERLKANTGRDAQEYAGAKTDGYRYSVNVPGMREKEEDDEEEDLSGTERDCDDRPGGVLMPVVILLLFAAGAMLMLSGFMAAGQLLQIALYAAGGLLFIAAIGMVFRLKYPPNHEKRVQKRLEREEFLSRHLGFRENPDDPEYQSEQRRLEEKRRRRIEEARREDRREERRRALQENSERAAQERMSAERAAQERMPAENTAQAQEGTAAGRAAQERMSAERAAQESTAQGRAAGNAEMLSREMQDKEVRLGLLRQELGQLYNEKGALSSYDTETRAIDLASERILELSGKIYRESGQEFSENVSTLLAGLTEGRYNNIALDERMNVQINTPDRLLELSQVSFGTMNQIYLALRIAAGELFCQGAYLPVLLDEPFAMYDDERLESALRFLQSSGRQVVLFTCQRRELDILAKIGSA